MTSESGISILVTRVGRLWAIDPRFLASFEQRVQRGPQAFSDGVRPTQSQRGGTAVLPLYGVLTPRREYFSGTALNEFQGWLNEALRSTAVDRIVIDIDSPGGSVSGVTEAAAAIRKAKAFKPVVAVANSMAASAAYWIASQASEFVATPSGEVGSIGVFAMHQDISKALSQFGVQVTLISAGKYKVEGNPFEPLGDEARAESQRSVDFHYSRFIADVATGRHVSRAIVRESFGQGRVVEADRALRLGMVDRIDTLEQVVGRRNTPQRTARAMGYRQRLAEAEKRGPRAAAAERRLMIAEVNQALN